MGSFFRTSDALGITKLYLTGYTGTPKNPKLAKTSLGAELSVPWEYHASAVRLIKKLKEEHKDVQIIGLENNLPGKTIIPLNKFKPKFPLALVLGTETTGIPKNVRDLCDTFTEIPMKGAKESLNVSVAFGIALFEIKNK